MNGISLIAIENEGVVTVALDNLPSQMHKVVEPGLADRQLRSKALHPGFLAAWSAVLPALVA